MAGRSASHLSRIERGLHAPSFTVAAGIDAALGVRLNELATIQREHGAIDDALVAALSGRGVDPQMAQEITTRIPTPARRARSNALDDA